MTGKGTPVAHGGWSQALKSVRTGIKTSPWLRNAVFIAQNSVHAIGDRPLVDATDEGVDSRPSRGLTAMVRVKDEARFLPEWLAHHTNVGVEHVVLYDNNSTDDTARSVAPFVARGLATVVPWPTVPASPAAHLHFLARYGPSSDWVAFFDADEFLVEATPGDLVDILATTRAPAVAVNWRYYGSAGHETVPDGLVAERFDRADASLNHHVKVIARPRDVIAYRNSHNFYYRRGRLARTTDGRRVLGSFVAPADAPRLVLNHYVYRSREDYERKAQHGFVDASGAKDRARQAELAEREFTNHNDVPAPLPAATLAATAARLADLGYPRRLYLPGGTRDEAVRPGTC